MRWHPDPGQVHGFLAVVAVQLRAAARQASHDEGVHDFDAELWRWEGDAPWHFLTLPGDLSDDVRGRPGAPRGFGSVRVRVTVGGSTWSTSLFPDSKRGAYVLPVKKAVRVAEGLEPGDVVKVSLELI